jgi:hypothetical protein
MVRRLIQPRLTKHEFQDGFLDRSNGAFVHQPFRSPIGVWGPWVTLASATPHLATDASLTGDLAALERLQLKNCAYGAGTYPLRPFTVPFAGSERPSAAEVLEALEVRNFASEHIKRLETATLPFPGYHAGTLNDELHTDPLHQYLFTSASHEKTYGEPPDEAGLASRQAHEGLRAEVAGPLYYLLLHEDGGKECQLVVLLATGKSRRGARLLGVVTQQVCHNLCD